MRNLFFQAQYPCGLFLKVLVKLSLADILAPLPLEMHSHFGL
jgi:hypothetical protein